jgi:hypothetical protein
MDQKKWTGGLTRSVTRLQPIRNQECIMVVKQKEGVR